MATVDYSAIAKEYGGNIVDEEIDYAASAAEFGGAVANESEPPKRGFTDVIKDVGVSFAGGANALLETGGNLAGLVGAADMDNWAAKQGESGKKYWDEQKSSGLKADEAERRAAIDSADGQWSKAGTAFWETVKNPALLSSFAAEQVPMFLPIGMAGRAGSVVSLATGAAGKTASVAGKVAGKVGAEGIAARIAQKGLAGISTAEKAAGAIGTTTGIGAGALLQGADVGGDTYNDVLKLPQSLWEHNADYQSLRMQVGDQPAKEAIAHDLAQQAATEGGVASVLTNLLPFARTFERATAGAPTKLKGNIVARGIKGFAGESLQEASEEGWGKVASNRAAQEIDASRGLEEGVGEAAGMGAVGGGVMGGVMGMASNPAPPGSLTSAANIAAQQGIIPNEAIDAAELLGTPEVANTAPPLTEAAQAPLAEPASMSILDGVTNGATSRPISTTLDTGSATGASDNTAGSDTNGVLQHDAATGAGRLGMPGTAVEDDGAGGVQSNGSNQPRHVGHPSEVVLPDNSALPAQWEVVDADQVTATLKEGKNQPRDRSRAAADAQVQGIANMPDYRRLADSPVMDVGAPTISHDGAIVGGNGRFEGVSRAYDQGTAAEYRARLEADAVTKGIDPATFSGMSKPVLVRRITQPFDTRALAVASNSGGSLQYSALEQAKIDGERMNGLGDIDVNDTGDVVMSGANMTNVRRALTGYNAAELGSMTDKDGLLSQEGIRRIKNALLYKAYGNSSVLSRLVESADPDLKSVMGALVRSAGSVASVRADMKDGNKPISVDIADDLLSSVEQLAKIKAQGSSVEQHLSQQGMFGNQTSAESAVILRYLSDNIRSQKRMAGFIKQYYDGLASEDHLTGSMFAAAPVTKKERLSHAITETERANPAAGQVSPISARQTAPRPDSEPVAQTGQQPANAQGDAERGGTGQPDTGVTGDGTKTAPITVEHHDHVKQAEQRVNTNPTDAQKEAGNYQKAHVQWNGLDITIENPQGSIRSGKDANGKAWEVTMPATYGYIKRTEGADGEHIDVYLGKHLQNQTVYVIDQIDLKTGKFDEHKNMLGFATLREAERIYKLGFSDGKGKHRLGATTPMTLEKFKEWIKTEDTTKPVAESLLTSYTQADIAKREQSAQVTTAEDQAAVDRAVEHSRNQPLLLSAQTQERSEGKTSQAGMFTPDGRASVAAEQSDKAKADADMQAALADMGAIMRDLAGVKRVMPEDHAKLLPVLVRLFDAAFRKGYYDIREATRYVRKALSEFAETAPYAKFLPVSLMDQAAKEAAAKMPDGFFENQGLFGQAAQKPVVKDSLTTQSETPSVQAGNVKHAERTGQFKVYESFIKRHGLNEELAREIRGDNLLANGETDALLAMRTTPDDVERVQDRMTNADKKSDSRNFKLPALHEFVPADVLARAHDLIAKAPKVKPPTISAEDRAAAEAALKPLLAKAEKSKPEFDRMVVEIASEVGIGEMLAPVKGILRAAEKLHLDGRSASDLFGKWRYETEKMRDLLRATIVVKSPDDVQAAIKAIREKFVLDRDRKGERLKDRFKEPDALGYRDILINVVLKDGTVAEIQINIPEMIAAKEPLGHGLYEHSRTLRDGDPLKVELEDAQKALYAAAFARSPKKYSSDTESKYEIGMLSIGQSDGSSPSSQSSLNQLSPILQKASPPSDSKNLVPSGNLSGNFISGSSKHTIAKSASEVHNDATGSGENTTQGAQHENRSAGAGSTEGQSAATAGAAQGKRKSGSVHPDISGRHIVRNNHPVIADSDQARVQRPGQDAAGAGGNTQRGDTAGAGDRAGGVAGLPAGQPGTGAVGVVDGRAGRAVSAGRDIPAKTGGNYHFTEADLDYKGGWIAKAKQNVEAVELVKKLDKEGRKATRAEQAILAKFIGWGASEIRNNIFDKKLDEQLETLAKYDEAIASLGNKPYLTNSNYREYHPAFEVLRAKNPALNWYAAGNITKAMLDAAKPDKSVSDWGKLRDRLRAVMSDEDWKTAERSTQYAHYTGKEVATEILRAADRLGFKGGSMLEPGAGIGVFPGLMNSAMANNSIYTGIEFDALTGAILKHLQPDERILVESFIDSALPDNFYDVAIGNPPFSDSKVLSDPRYKKHAFALHDYFFAKTMDKVKPGGLVIFVTSRYTMDKQGDKARQYLAERADLLGAIRLPETAFKKNAGTEVVTDILFLRKKVPGETFEGHGWMGLEKIKVKGGDHLINEYFAKHPEMVLGEGAIDKNGMYAQNQYTVLPNKDVPITELLAKAVDSLPRDVFRPAEESSAKAAQVQQLDFNPKAKKEGNYYVSDDGKLMQVESRMGVPAKVKGIDGPLVRSFVRLRDALNQTQYDQLNDGDWETSLKALQKEYKAFVRVHGHLLQNTVVERKAMVEDEDGNEVEDIISSRRFKLIPKLNDDPEYSKVLALETINDDTGEIKESDFLTKRTLDQRKESKISTPHDALLSSLNDLGRVDIPLIAQRIGLSETETINSLGTAIYETPSDGWQMADEYLSGNVKAKLKEAEAAAKTDRRFARNVEALMNAQPSPVPPSDITASLGMNWIPGEVYAQFLHEKTGVKANISYNEHTGNWNVSVISGNKTNRATVDWGTIDRDAADIMEAGLTGRTIRITAKDPDTKATVFQPAATEAAIQKLREMRQAFADWMWQDNERTEKLVTLYNDKFNTTVSRKFDGRHLTLPGTTTTISVFDHVKRGAWRIIQSGNTYLAHAVGSGKTWEMVISAMEQKRLGMIGKPMMVVPNHMLQQFSQEWLQLYPAARLMVADEKQFHTDNRRRFIARVGMSDLDGVIITHSAFKLLDLDPEFKDKMMNEQLDYYRAALEEVQDAEGDSGDAKKSRSPKVRDIQNRIEKLEEKLKATMSGEGKDKNVRFDEMGVDMLYVDEAHEYRKLEFSTVRQVKGISSTGSDRAFDLFMKTRWLEEKNPGRSLVMASGTPVTNTMAEMYSVQRFMQPKVLEEKGLQTFDAWASMFGEESTEIEADASGKYAPVTRFANIVNVPELTQMFREFADVLTSEHLAEMLGDKRPSVKYGARKLVITPQVDDYMDYKKELAARLEKSRRWKPSRDEPNNPDPVIRIIGDGRLAAIDMRFIDPTLSSDPASKLNVLIDGVIKSYKKGADYTFNNKAGKEEEIKGTTQMVFSDIGFGAGVAAHRGFNARAWFEKRLRDAGIPQNQVVFMSDLKKSDAKQKAFKDMNSGRVRILVGSSKNMGTGVNAQQRLRALHHLDTPWYPADLEQREGRIVRQGNKNRRVRIFAYSTKGSYDTNMWQLLARKQRFIDQALSGDSSVRRLEDISEASQFQMATAMTAGDERAIRLAGLKSDIDRYQRLYRSHEETRMRLAQEIVRAKYAIEVAERKLPDAEKMAGKVKDLSGDKFTAKAGKATYAKRKDWGDALLANLKTYSDTAKEGVEIVGEVSGMPIEIIGNIDRNNDGKVLGYYVRMEMRLGEDGVIIGRDPNDDAVGLSMRATNALAAVERKPEELRKTIIDAKSQISANESRTGAKFQFAQEMADKIKEAKELEAEMERDGKDHSNSELVQKAKAFAEKHHSEIDQRRKFTGEPYIMHPQGVVDILRTVPHTEEMLAAAWAHDTVEDTKATLDDVRAELGDKVADLVEQLTKPYDIGKMTPAAQTIKLADITHNAEAAKDAPADFTRRYLPKKAAELELLKGGNQELWGRAKQAIEGDDAPLTSRAPQTETPEFKRWFGDSKVVDDEGRPLVMYHATKEDFSVFKTGKGGYSGHAIWLSPHKEFQPVAHSIGRSIGEMHSYVAGAKVMKLFAKIERPLLLDNSDMVKWAQNSFASGSENFPQLISDGIVAELRDAGYDGIIFKGTKLKGWGKYADEYIVFEPDQIKSAIGNNGQFDPANPDIRASKSSPNAGQTIESVKQATAKLRASWHGFKQVRIVQSVKEIPNELYLRALRAAKPIAQDSEGIYDPKTRTVYLIADNIASPERAVWVAIHEVAGHGGIRMLGSPVVDALEFAGKNGFVKKLAQAIAADRGETFDSRTHTDEAIAELAAATITGNVDAIMERYGIKVPMGMRSNLLGMIKRVVDAVRQFIGRVTGKPVEAVSDGEVLGMIRSMKDAVEGVEQRYDTAGVSNGVMASHAQEWKAIDIISARFKEAVNSFLRGDVSADGNIRLADNTPASLQLFGWEDSPVAVKSKVIDKLVNDHALNESQFAKIPHLMRRPTMMFGDAKNNSIVMIGELRDGKPALIALRPERVSGHEITLVVTGYEPNLGWAEVTKRIARGELIYRDTTKTIPDVVKIALNAAQKKYSQASESRYLPKELLSGRGASVVGSSYKILWQSDLVKLEQEIWGDAPLFSGAPAQPPQEKQQPRILRMAKKASMEADTSLIDKVVSAPFKLAGWNRIVEPALDRLLDRAGEFVPEKVKAGLVSDYGLGADYIDRKAEMKAAEAAQNRKSAGLVEMLAALTRAESRVAYQWMQEKPDTATEQALLEKLPTESRETLARLKKMISDMGKDAVHLGQMSQEAYQRNNMAYLHRTYAKHVLAPQGAISKMLRARALKIKGNQYKGRGIFDEVRMDAVGAEGVFGRKLQQGQADKSLVGEKLIRFERRDDSTDAMDALPGMTKKPMGKLREVAYWPASTPVPQKFGDWVNSGTFEVRDTKGDKLVVWRDFTPDERERMGELDEVRYAVAQTLQMMTHDIEVGRFFAWTAKTYGKAKPDGRETTASESMLHSFGKDEWVQVPSAVIPGTQTKKYGALAGLYIPGAVWNDIRQTAGTRIEPFGHTHEKVLQFWKKAKTAWSPAVHMNNVMANFVIADWHDLRAADLAEALKVWAYNNRDGYREIYQRFEDSGALGGMFLSNEALRDEIAKHLESMKAELTGEQEAKDEMTRMAKVMHLVTMAGMVPVKGAKLYAGKMEDAYQFEDAIFRLATFTKAIRYGKSDIEAGRIARHSFLNYDINAPWIQAARHTLLPFVSFFYRALPMALNTVKSKPWKVVKLMAFWHLVSMAGYMMSGGDEDEERALLPKEKQGSVWGVVPKMVRMPWNHDDDAPYFLDIRRWVPVGDVADIEMGAGMLPPWATPGGPLIMLAETLMANKSFFTEKEIVLDTDTQGEKLEKRLDHLFKGMLPNVPLPNPLNLQTPAGEINPLGLTQGSGQSYAWSGIERSMLKREGSIGEVRNTPAAIANTFGIKVSAYPAQNMEVAKNYELSKQVREIKATMNKISRNFNNLEEPTTAEQARHERDMDRQRAKLEEVQEGR